MAKAIAGQPVVPEGLSCNMEPSDYIPLGEEHDLVAGLGGKVAGQVQVLAGEILVDEKKLHSLIDARVTLVRGSLSCRREGAECLAY